jgi:hypothetical protein
MVDFVHEASCAETFGRDLDLAALGVQAADFHAVRALDVGADVRDGETPLLLRLEIADVADDLGIHNEFLGAFAAVFVGHAHQDDALGDADLGRGEPDAAFRRIERIAQVGEKRPDVGREATDRLGAFPEHGVPEVSNTADCHGDYENIFSHGAGNENVFSETEGYSLGMNGSPEARARKIRMLDAVILLGIAAVAIAFYIRVRHPDLVSSPLTDLTRRETVRVVVALPTPWARPPLAELPRSGDAELGDGGRDSAVFRALEFDTSWPRARFEVTARVDREERRWFNFAEVTPGANFSFHQDGYAMQGIILEVEGGDSPQKGAE